MEKLLYHNCLSPFSRKIMLMLNEKNIEYKLCKVNPWERKKEFLVLNPASTVPVFVEASQLPIASHYAIAEYLNEAYPQNNLMGNSMVANAEVRRLTDWFDNKFYEEVFQNLVFEKLEKWIRGLGSPDSAKISAGIKNLKNHLNYLDWLLERRNWIAGDNITIADLSAAAQLSLADYIGNVPWEDHKETKNWYAKIKSRPSFRAILNDRIAGVAPHQDYDNLDF